MRLRLLTALLLPLACAHAAAPVRYDLSASIDSVPLKGGPNLGTKFFFAQNNQAVYRVIPAGQDEANPAARWRYWSASLGKKSIFPATGYASLEVGAMNASGGVIGKSVTETPAHKESALYWTSAGGSRRPFGFDAGYSGLNAINSAGQGAGFSNSGTYEVVTWNAQKPGAGTTKVRVPAGYTSPQVGGLSALGKVLLYLRDGSGFGRAAIWNGTTTAPIGPAPTETFYPSNCAINSAGDVAVLVFTAGGSAILHYIPAAAPKAWLTFTFPGPVDSNVYNLRISDAGVASFDTSINGLNTVAVVSSVTRQQLSFTGYRSYLNHNGVLIFGNEGKINFWDAAAWAGQPVVVPISAAVQSGGMDVVGFNDDGYLLVLNTLASTRSLDVLKPIFQSPPEVTVRPISRTLRLSTGSRIKTLTVETFVKGDPLACDIRYAVLGQRPRGLRFLKGSATLIGAPKEAGTFTLRIAATYKSGAVRKQSGYAKIKVVVRSR